MVDRGRVEDLNEAAARFADALAESYRIVYMQAAENQQRQQQLAREFSEQMLGRLREQAESGRAASEQLVEQSRRQQEAGRELARESVSAYMEFLDTAFTRYQANTRGSAQAISETAAGVVGTAAGVVGATAGAAAGAAKEAAQSGADQLPPITGYDEMNVDEINQRLDELSETELIQVRDYERRNKNRATLLAQIERRLEASS